MARTIYPSQLVRQPNKDLDLFQEICNLYGRSAVLDALERYREISPSSVLDWERDRCASENIVKIVVAELERWKRNPDAARMELGQPVPKLSALVPIKPKKKPDLQPAKATRKRKRNQPPKVVSDQSKCRMTAEEAGELEQRLRNRRIVSTEKNEGYRYF